MKIYNQQFQYSTSHTVCISMDRVRKNYIIFFYFKKFSLWGALTQGKIPSLSITSAALRMEHNGQKSNFKSTYKGADKSAEKPFPSLI